MIYPNMANAKNMLGNTSKTHESMRDQLFDSGNTDLKHFLGRSQAALKARDSSKPSGASFKTEYAGSGTTKGYGEKMCGEYESNDFKERMAPRSLSKVQQKRARHLMLNELEDGD